MNAILKDAEQRIEAATAHAHTTAEHILEGMRQEIGPQAFSQAEDNLPTIEKAIRTEIRPFVAGVQDIERQAKNPLPARVRHWLTELAEGCESAPRQLRGGIEAYKTLRVPWWKDGKTVDQTERARLISFIRRDLKSFDGRLTFFTQRKGQVEAYIQASGWPAAQPGAATLPAGPTST